MCALRLPVKSFGLDRHKKVEKVVLASVVCLKKVNFSQLISNRCKAIQKRGDMALCRSRACPQLLSEGQRSAARRNTMFDSKDLLVLSSLRVSESVHLRDMYVHRYTTSCCESNQTRDSIICVLLQPFVADNEDV